MKASHIFLSRPFKLTNGTVIELGNQLAHDQLIITAVLPALGPLNPNVPSLYSHITLNLYMKDGNLPDIDNIRAVFYDAVYQWCKEQFPNPIPQLYKIDRSATGPKLAEAIKIIADLIDASTVDIKNYFSGRKVNNIRAFAQEFIEVTNQIAKQGSLEDEIGSNILRFAHKIQENYK
jgi:hypothetical protein